MAEVKSNTVTHKSSGDFELSSIQKLATQNSSAPYKNECVVVSEQDKPSPELVNVVPGNFTENGDYTAPTGTAYNPVKVDVAGGGGDVTSRPTFSPAAGAIKFGSSVTISCADAGATIYYTTDGSTPTTASTTYSTPIVVNEAVTIKAMALVLGKTPSVVAAAAYTQAKTAKPTFSPAAGQVETGTTVAISCSDSGATIYYTTDGSTPTTASSQYSNPIAVNEAMTIKAAAIVDGKALSDVSSASYTIAPAALYYWSGLYNATAEADYVPTPITKEFLNNLAGVKKGVATGKGFTDDSISGDDDEGYTRYVYAYPKSYGLLSTYAIIGGFPPSDINAAFTHVEATIDGNEYYVYYLTDSIDTDDAGIIYA